MRWFVVGLVFVLVALGAAGVNKWDGRDVPDDTDAALIRASQEAIARYQQALDSQADPEELAEAQRHLAQIIARRKAHLKSQEAP